MGGVPPSLDKRGRDASRPSARGARRRPPACSTNGIRAFDPGCVAVAVLDSSHVPRRIKFLLGVVAVRSHDADVGHPNFLFFFNNWRRRALKFYLSYMYFTACIIIRPVICIR
jgi:hypothetical protein